MRRNTRTITTGGTRAVGERDRSALRPGYFRPIFRSAAAILEGMAITFSYLFKKPITVQYPDRLPRPLNQSLPERYRGFLEVDLDTCTGCKACERDCPIACIKIDLEKVGDVRAMTRFDIDMGKCMYCNICVESCPVPGHAPGDTEDTKCIRMTREFEGATDSFPTLTFRFIRPGNAVIPYKHKRGEVPPTPQRGTIAADARARAAEYNRLAAGWALARIEREKADAAVDTPVSRARRSAELAPKVTAAAGDPAKLVDLLHAEALAQTDCGDCGYPTCRDYARALLQGDKGRDKCEPGGTRTHRDVVLLCDLIESIEKTRA